MKNLRLKITILLIVSGFILPIQAQNETHKIEEIIDINITIDATEPQPNYESMDSTEIVEIIEMDTSIDIDVEHSLEMAPHLLPKHKSSQHESSQHESSKQAHQEAIEGEWNTKIDSTMDMEKGLSRKTSTLSRI